MFNFPSNFKWSAEGRVVDETLDEMRYKSVKVGYDENSGAYPDGTPVAQVAAYNEYGTESIPSRPFVRSAMENATKSIFPDIVGSAWDALMGASDSFYEAMGERGKEAIQESIDSGAFTPDAPATIEAKGSTQPLVDTGLLRDSITVKIEER